MDARASILATIILALSAVGAGCTTPAPPCTPLATSPGAVSACFTTSDGWILQGVVFNGSSTGPTILLVTGLNENHHSYDTFAHELAIRGFRVLAFDSRGMGNSTELTNGTHRTLADFQESDVPPMVNDLAAASTYLRDTPPIIVGASVGANEALTYASVIPLIRAVVLLSAGLDYHGLAITAPNLLYHGDVDYIASQGDTYAASSTEQLEKARPDQPLHILPGAAHGTAILENATTRGAIEGWILSHRT
ncbi:MAG: alpha/beta hydrolase [Thermoplasmatota archaeon]